MLTHSTPERGGQPANHCRSHLEVPASSLFSYTRDNFQESLKPKHNMCFKRRAEQKEPSGRAVFRSHSFLILLSNRGENGGAGTSSGTAWPNDESLKPLNPAQGSSLFPEVQVLPTDSSDRKTRVPDRRVATDGGRNKPTRLISSRPHRRAKPGLLVSAQ